MFKITKKLSLCVAGSMLLSGIAGAAAFDSENTSTYSSSGSISGSGSRSRIMEDFWGSDYARSIKRNLTRTLSQINIDMQWKRLIRAYRDACIQDRRHGNKKRAVVEKIKNDIIRETTTPIYRLGGCDPMRINVSEREIDLFASRWVCEGDDRGLAQAVVDTWIIDGKPGYREDYYVNLRLCLVDAIERLEHLYK